MNLGHQAAFWFGVTFGLLSASSAKADWLATISRFEHYQQLIVDADSRQAQLHLLEAAEDEPRLSKAERAKLHEDAARNRPPYLVVQRPQTPASGP